MYIFLTYYNIYIHTQIYIIYNANKYNICRDASDGGSLHTNTLPMMI